MANTWEYEFEQSLEGVADFIHSRLLKKIDEYDLVVTGQLRNNVRVNPPDEDEFDEDYVIQVTSEDYGFVLNKGVQGINGGGKSPSSPFIVSPNVSDRPGSPTGGFVGVAYRDILQWVVDRGIQFAGQSKESTARTITRSIRTNGIAARPWLDDILIDELPEIDRRIEKALTEASTVAIQGFITRFLNEPGRRVRGGASLNFR